LRSSRSRSWIEFAVHFIGWRMRRCAECNSRFVQCGRKLVRTSRLKTLERGILLCAGAAGAVGVVLAAILYFGHSESAPSAEGILLFL
jgi:hypothetical protein